MTLDKSVFLSCSPDAAFRLFTQEISKCWPVSHRRSKEPASQLFLLESGRFYELAPDTREFDLGRVRAWEPPQRLLLDFYLGTDAEHPTEVEVTFTPESAGTRVRIKHRPGAASEGCGLAAWLHLKVIGMQCWRPSWHVHKHSVSFVLR